MWRVHKSLSIIHEWELRDDVTKYATHFDSSARRDINLRFNTDLGLRAEGS